MVARATRGTTTFETTDLVVGTQTGGEPKPSQHLRETDRERERKKERETDREKKRVKERERENGVSAEGTRVADFEQITNWDGTHRG